MAPNAPRSAVETVTVAGTVVPVVVPVFGPLGDTWVEHLSNQVDPAWRPGEWDHDAWVFIPDADNPQTRLFRCPRRGCGVPVSRDQVCVYCSREQKRNQWTADELLATTRAEPPRVRSHLRRPNCAVSDATSQCQREQLARGLCNHHYIAFDAMARGAASKTETAMRRFLEQRSDPQTRLLTCEVPACGHEQHTARTPFCNVHYAAFNSARRKDETITQDEWVARDAEPFLPAYSLPLVLLPQPLRTEVLFGMQSFDAGRGLLWDASNWSRVIQTLRMSRATSMLNHTVEEWVDGSSSSTHHMLRHMVQALGVEDDRFHGRELDEGVLSSFDLGLSYSAKKPNKEIQHRQRAIDFSGVSQSWLRSAAVHWIRTTKPNMEEVRRCETLLGHVSHHLRATRRDDDDVTTLTLGDMDGIAALINRTWTKHKTQSNYFAVWWKVVTHARRHGLWNNVPDEFMRDPRKHMPTGATSADPDEDPQALPMAAVRQLNRHLDKVGSDYDDSMRGGLPASLRAARDRTMLVVTRDTGRRPSEVVSLSHDCLKLDTDGRSWALIWDNTKAKRLGRRLPIDSETVKAINDWKALMAEHGLHSQWLFPSPAQPKNHVSTGTLEAALDAWVRVTPPLRYPVTGVDGDKVLIDFNTVTLYSFRHTYAQRHADAGVDPDDLRALMDHRSIKTTMGYYQVGWKRKKEAASKMAEYTQDRFGNPVGLPESRRGLSRVAVPYGGCVEPTNVQAGGSGCPIRFQCASCDFFRPDPSHLPALEQEIHDLRKNLASARAMGQPAHVLENFEGQIADYTAAVEKMHQTLAALPEDERTAVEHHAAIMRRARAAEAAGRSFTLLVDGDESEEAS